MAKKHWMPKFDLINPGNEAHTRAWRDALDVIRIEVDHNTLKDEFVAWARTNAPNEVSRYVALPAWAYMSIGRIAFAINHGAVPPEETARWFQNKVAELNKKLPEIDDAVSKTEDEEIITPRARRINEYVNLYSFVDAVLVRHSEDGEKIEEMIKDRLRRAAPNRAMLKKLYVHFKDSMSSAIAERDNPLVEKTIAPLILAVNILAAASGNAKVAGYKGAKVGRKAAKAAEKVTYKVMDSGTNLASVAPAQIPGTNAVVIYNTKNRKAMIYKAKAGGVLDLKGTKITGFDEATTVSKTLRKPKEILPMLRDAINSRRIDIVFGYVNGKNHKVNGKINKDMVIVKVFK